MGGSGEDIHTPEAESGDSELLYSQVDEELFEKRKETKFLLKLDVCLMTWAWLAYLIKVGSNLTDMNNA